MSNLILDTGPLIALLNRDEKSHPDCVAFLKDFRGELLTTEPVLTEALYLLNESFSNQKKCLEFVAEIVELVPSSRATLQRVLKLMEKYQDVPMDYADATLVALAEEIEIGDIFTLDRRGFETFRWDRNRAFKIFP